MRTKGILLLAMTICALAHLAKGDEQRPISILGALQVEIDPILKQLTEAKEESIMGIRFVRGELHGRSVIVARTGVGKVNAAITSTLLIERYRPAQVIFTGIAGAANPAIRPRDVVICTKAAQHDFGVIASDKFHRHSTRSISSRRPHGVFLQIDSKLVEAAKELISKSDEKDSANPSGSNPSGSKPSVSIGTVVTGDAFIASREKIEEIRRWSNADVVEMEGAAVAQVCKQFNVSWLIVRACSDSATEKARSEIEANRKQAAENAARVAESIVAEIAE